MDPSSSPWRGLRLVLYLVVFNAGAAWSLLSGQAAGTLVAWIGLVGLLRLGLRPAAIMLEGRLAPVLRVGAGLAAAASIAGTLQAVGVAAPRSPVLAALLAGLALADGVLAAREAPGDRDPAHLVTLGLWLLAAAWIPAAADHPAERWVTGLGAVLAALAATTVVLGAIRGDPTRNPIPGLPGVGTLDGVATAIRRPRRALPAAVLAFLAGGLHPVPTGHQAVIERLGYPLPDPVGPGLRVRLPPPLERVVTVDVEHVHSESIVDQGATLLCGDQSMLSVEARLHWRVADARAFAYAVTDPAGLLSDLGHAALVEAVAHLGVDEVLTTGRATLEQQVARRVQAAADHAGLGVRIDGVHIATAAVPPPVTDAFLEVISAEEEKRAAINQAEAYAADLLPRTRGAALARIEEAQGEAARIQAHADAEFATFLAIVEGGAQAPELIRFGLAHDRLAGALGPARITVSSPRLQTWIGGSPARPVHIADDGNRSSP
ncbi:MAG: protease modulator HflK [Deltaproteobacteria bacterium]|nr:MAG: protease modulator HflK [Deltaproteobacteria bacterium]